MIGMELGICLNELDFIYLELVELASQAYEELQGCLQFNLNIIPRLAHGNHRVQ